MIPLHRPSLGHEELEAVREVFESGWLGLGKKVADFEAALAEFLGVRHVVCVNSGTSALYLSMLALGLGPGDEIVMPSLTFVSGLQAALFAGMRVKFCDIEAETLNLSVSHLEKLVTSRTRAVLAFHCSGLPCDLDAVLSLCRERGLWTIEDAAHALGSLYKGKRIGGFGDATCFSFDPIKLITCGEGGAVVVKDKSAEQRLRSMRNLGMEKDAWRFHAQGERREHKVCTRGLRLHMSDLNAAIGLVQLKRINDFIKRRQEIARYYDACFAGVDGLRVIYRQSPNTVPFNYIVHVPGKGNILIEHLNRDGIQANHPYMPNHLQPLVNQPLGSLPVTESIYADLVAIPLHPSLTDQEVEKVCQSVLTAFQKPR